MRGQIWLRENSRYCVINKIEGTNEYRVKELTFKTVTRLSEEYFRLKCTYIGFTKVWPNTENEETNRLSKIDGD